ncbi:uncharacterized protein LOC116263797 isoform X2 [Nymphaea colorata]|uniref:uncharacterized protein LOC116263797 isoform X2 n=1 Tax=Nymphaea colorata TaxID=210225 RepID=UPI00214F1C78|nr:uncharacterized protein LOC116263797 isoform X2 [Nymphaea colorata]
MALLLSTQHHRLLLPFPSLHQDLPSYCPTIRYPLKRRLPNASLNAPPESRLNFDLKEGQHRHFHKLPSGLNMEVIVQTGFREETSETVPPKPPLVFVHGSFHAAWCWSVHWLPFFSSFGYDCYALSLLGQGESDVPVGQIPGSLQTHTRDVANFIQEVLPLPPVLLGHSFGGLVVQSYISNMISGHANSKSGEDMHRQLAGAVLVCSVPPTGNSGLITRYIFSKPVAAFKVTLSLAAKAFATSLSLCKETFFSPNMDDHQVKQYQELMKESSKVPLFDLRKLNATLPIPLVPKDSVDILVMGGTDDLIVFV